MRAPRSEAGADAMRDALAMVRAVLDGDEEALAVVAENAGWPALTLGIMAGWTAGMMRAAGTGEAELAAWQDSAGLR